MPLTAAECAELMIAAGRSERDLDAIIACIRKNNPTAFHTPESLSERVFYHEPISSVPCRGFVHVNPPEFADTSKSLYP